MQTSNPVNESALFVNTFLKAWNLQISRMNDLLEKLGDEDLQKEIAPGKNTGVYLLGHMAAAHDALFPLLGFGQRLHPDLEKPFLTSPDKSGLQFPPVVELKKAWNNINNKLMEHYMALAPQEWLAKHTAVSAEDFAKEPHRNKLNVLITRTAHVGYHVGQLVLLKRK